MIQNVFLQNFKVLREVDVWLQPLTLLVGPNGSGKSSILSALEYGFDHLNARTYNPPRFPRLDYFEAVKSRFSLGPLVIHLAFKENCGVSITDQQVQIEGDPSILRRGMLESTLLDLNLGKLAAPSSSQEIIPNLPSDGEGLAWFLAGLQLEFPERFSEMLERLREVVPTVRRLRLKRTTLDTNEIGFALLFDMKGGDGIPASAVSEGTLITLALLVVLTSPSAPGLILIENLERGLHPKALGNLIAQIRSLQSHNSDLQIVATSHSPYLLDYLKADEILLTSLNEDGYASAQALSEHPDYDRWKDVMAPGEFWSTVGESWVVQKS
jgi:predicted ATPase